MMDFWEWLLEVRQPYVSQSVLQGYEHAFQNELNRLIQRTQDPMLRLKFERMRDCPVMDSRGQCRSFTDYILSALIKNGVHNQHDIEAALGYVVEKMIMDKGDAGEARNTLFTGFEERPGEFEGNPLQGRFMSYLQFAIKNITGGKVPRLSTQERRPQGTVSIGQGRLRGDATSHEISPDAIPARPAGEPDLNELVSDITSLLQRKERETGLPLVKMFQGMMQGEKTEYQRKVYGDRPSRKARDLILSTTADYARATGNIFLLKQVQMLSGHNPSTPLPQRRTPEADLTETA